MALNDRQRRFCEEIVQGKSATQAYIAAGFSAKGAAQGAERLLRNVDVSAKVDEMRTQSAERAGITVDYILERLQDNLERALTAEPVRDRDGNETGEYVYEGAVANRAAELLGKYLGMFSDRVEHTGKNGAPIQVWTFGQKEVKF